MYVVSGDDQRLKVNEGFLVATCCNTHSKTAEQISQGAADGSVASKGSH